MADPAARHSWIFSWSGAELGLRACLMQNKLGRQGLHRFARIPEMRIRFVSSRPLYFFRIDPAESALPPFGVPTDYFFCPYTSTRKDGVGAGR